MNQNPPPPPLGATPEPSASDRVLLEAISPFDCASRFRDSWVEDALPVLTYYLAAERATAKAALVQCEELSYNRAELLGDERRATYARAESAESALSLLTAKLAQCHEKLAKLATGTQEAEEDISELQAKLSRKSEALLIVTAAHAKALEDSRRIDWLDENMNYHGGGNGGTYSFKTPADVECGQLRQAIDSAISAATPATTGKDGAT